MPPGATCSPISKATTIGNGDTPRSATSPLNRHRQKPHNPVSTFRGEGQSRPGSRAHAAEATRTLGASWPSPEAPVEPRPDHAMILGWEGFRREPQMSATPDSTFADEGRFNAEL